MNLRPLLLLLVFAFAVHPLSAQGALRTVLVLGDSLTAGYGLEEPATEAYPAIIQQKLDARAAADPAAARWRVVNAGISGDTTSGGLRRIDWVLRQPVDILILALGANDGLRGLPPDLIRRNLLAIAAKVKAKNPSVRVLLAGMKMPANMGDYAAEFERIYPELASAQSWALAPFMLEGVGGVPELNQADAIHPNPAGHKKIADTIWAHLLQIL